MNQRVALVTGGGYRIGEAITRRLHQSGLAVIVHYRRSAALAGALVDELNTVRPGSAALVAGDLSADGEPAQIANASLNVFGRIDLLVNNASGFYPTPIGEGTSDQWDDLTASNLKGPYFLTQALVPALRATKGAIVNIVDVYTDLPLEGYSIYGSAKAGVAYMTRALAKELGPDIRVNGIAPGAILWPAEHSDALDPDNAEAILSLTALKRMGSPEDIASAVHFLGLEAHYVTGQILAVDGGRSLY